MANPNPNPNPSPSPNPDPNPNPTPTPTPNPNPHQVLTESFLWLPSLEGPVRSYTEGTGWLFQWVDGAPKLGWDSP